MTRLRNANHPNTNASAPGTELPLTHAAASIRDGAFIETDDPVHGDRRNFYKSRSGWPISPDVVARR